MSKRWTAGPAELRGDHGAQVTEQVNVQLNGCWHFTGYIAPTGYGQVGRNTPAHRVAWEVANGTCIPDGMHIDHTCHGADTECRDNADCLHRRCVNPAHLEPVTPRVNLLRGRGFAHSNALVTHCPAGHEYDARNTYLRPDRHGRICRACRAERAREARKGLVA